MWLKTDTPPCHLAWANLGLPQPWGYRHSVFAGLLFALSPSLTTPFSFPRVVLKATAATFLRENTQLISCCACILTSSKSRTQFSVICCSTQFHFKRVPCTVSLLATKLHSFTAFLVLPQYSSASHSSRLPAFSSFLSPSSVISFAVFSPRFQFLTPNWKLLLWHFLYRRKSHNPRFALLHLIFQFGLNNKHHLVIMLTSGNLDTGGIMNRSHEKAPSFCYCSLHLELKSHCQVTKHSQNNLT